MQTKTKKTKSKYIPSVSLVCLFTIYLVGRLIISVDLFETRALLLVFGLLGRRAEVAAGKLVGFAVCSDHVLLALRRTETEEEIYG